MKTVLAPMFKTRMLGVNGWFSTNILGNRDGEVLDDCLLYTSLLFNETERSGDRAYLYP